MNIELKILNEKFYKMNPETTLPSYATPGSAGMDLRITHDIYLHPNQTYLAGTGIAIHIDCAPSLVNCVGLIFPRSGLGHKLGVILGNGTGVIDEDFQQEIKISLLNRSDTLVELKAGDRVAQLVIVPIVKARFNVVEDFTNTTERGSFGSTGS